MRQLMQATSNKKEHLTILLMGKHPDEEADRHMDVSQEDDTKGEMNKEITVGTENDSRETMTVTHEKPKQHSNEFPTHLNQNK